MGGIGNNISILAIFFLSIAFVFIPAQNAYGLFSFTSELTEEEEIELYKLKQITNAEQVRDEYFIFSTQENPYINSLSNNVVFFEEDNEIPKSIDRKNEYLGGFDFICS